MKNILPIAILILGFHAGAFSQYGRLDLTKIPQPSFHYVEEYTFDSTLDATAWLSVPRGLQVSFASPDELYFRTEVPALNNIRSSWNGTGWKGERLNAQILVWSADTINQVRFIAHTLKNEKGNTIAGENIRIRMVRYVVSNFSYGARELTCGPGPDNEAYLMPDRFEEFDRFDLPGKTTRPIWVSIDIPREAVAGLYSGFIEYKTELHTGRLPLQIEVQSQVLPHPRDWTHRLDLWQNPWVVAWKNNIVPWSDQHKQLLKQHLKMYADAGGKYITTYAVHSPWADNSYMIEGAMIEWIRDLKGNWRFDYSIFDDYVQLAMGAGINKAITIYTPIPWGERFRFIDERSGNYVYERWVPTSDTFRKNWNIFLTDLRKHLQQKGWLGITYLGINENAMEQTLAAIKVIREHSKDWRITYAGDWHKELDALLDDYSYLYGRESSSGIIKQRAARGQTTTYYVCCNPAVPNNFVFSPPIEGRWISWYTAAYGYDGFLRWAYDAWPADPARDARHLLWPAGDSYLVYPGGAGCIRFEKLREGIVDYEKIRILKQKGAASKDKKVKSLITELDNHLRVFTTEKDFNTKKIIADVEKGKELLYKLSQSLRAEL